MSSAAGTLGSLHEGQAWPCIAEIQLDALTEQFTRIMDVSVAVEPLRSWWEPYLTDSLGCLHPTAPRTLTIKSLLSSLSFVLTSALLRGFSSSPPKHGPWPGHCSATTPALLFWTQALTVWAERMLLHVAYEEQPPQRLLLSRRSTLGAIQSLLGLDSKASFEWWTWQGGFLAADPAVELCQVEDDLGLDDVLGQYVDTPLRLQSRRQPSGVIGFS